MSHTLERGSKRESSTCKAVKEICKVKAFFSLFLFFVSKMLSTFANFTIFTFYHPKIFSSGILIFYILSHPAKLDLCDLKCDFFNGLDCHFYGV